MSSSFAHRIHAGGCPFAEAGPTKAGRAAKVSTPCTVPLLNVRGPVVSPPGHATPSSVLGNLRRSIEPCGALRSSRLLRRSCTRENWHDGTESREQAQPSTTTSAADAHQTVAKCSAIFQSQELDDLLEIVPDEVIDAVLARRKMLRKTDAITFNDVLQLGGQEYLHLDTFALRNLIYNAPSSIITLSTLMLGEDKFMERCLVRSQTGEECILTFTLTLQDVLQSQYR